jgi:hypothetical protein
VPNLLYPMIPGTRLATTIYHSTAAPSSMLNTSEESFPTDTTIDVGLSEIRIFLSAVRGHYCSAHRPGSRWTGRQV